MPHQRQEGQWPEGDGTERGKQRRRSVLPAAQRKADREYKQAKGQRREQHEAPRSQRHPEGAAQRGLPLTEPQERCELKEERQSIEEDIGHDETLERDQGSGGIT